MFLFFLVTHSQLWLRASHKFDDIPGHDGETHIVFDNDVVRWNVTTLYFKWVHVKLRPYPEVMLQLISDLDVVNADKLPIYVAVPSGETAKLVWRQHFMDRCLQRCHCECSLSLP